MISTPNKSDSNKNSIINSKSNNELSENKEIKNNSKINLSLSEKRLSQENNSNKNIKKISEIHEAIISDNLEKLVELLKLGENPDIIDKSGETPLYMSVDIENYDAMIILLEFGADCNIQKEDDGKTPLHLATEKKNDIYISSLLSHGANPNIINKTQLQTPLHICVINKINEFILIKFKENNGDIYNFKDKWNKTPFDYSKNDEKYKNLLISIFGNNSNYINNKLNEIKKNIEENVEETENNTNLNYKNFISLSRKIQLTNDENLEGTIINNNINNNNEGDSNTINDINNINNCIKKQLLFSSNSKEISSEEKNNKRIMTITSNNSGQDIPEKNSKRDSNKNILNMVSDRGSNYSINNQKHKINLTETNLNNNQTKNLILSPQETNNILFIE